MALHVLEQFRCQMLDIRQDQGLARLGGQELRGQPQQFDGGGAPS